MNDSLKGLRALVCGSTQGIGRASAELLAEQGASITLFARTESRLVSVRDELTTIHGQSHDYLAADFTEPEGVQAAEQAG